ncbi:hypothetical protein KIPB_011033, partial [Kipferlia bialata]|eukprot:g11033.t1
MHRSGMHGSSLVLCVWLVLLALVSGVLCVDCTCASSDCSLSGCVLHSDVTVSGVLTLQ